MKNCTIALAFLLFLPCLVFAKYMAVLETLSPNDLLTRQERLYLTDILRGQAVRALPAEQNWTIMTRENINVMLPPGKTIEDCEGSCLAETGKNIAADYVAQARISQIGKSLAISAELYETASSKLVASFAGKGETVDDIEKIIKEQAPAFFKKARGSEFGYVNAGSTFSFQGSQKVIVNIETNPAGAIPTIDGKAIPQCTNTPCSIQLVAGEHRLVLSKERFEDLDTIVNVVQNQTLNLALSSNIGILNIAPQILEEFRDKPMSVSIDGLKASLGSNELVPGVHQARISHACFDPIEFTVAIQKGETKTMADSLVRGIGGLELEVEKNGVPQAVSVFIDGKQVDTTPFASEVPLCAKIEIEYAGERREVPVDLKWHEVAKKVYKIEDKPKTVQDTIRQRADVAYAELDGKKVSAKPVEQSDAQADSIKPKRLWGGATLGLIYNDFYSTHFGLNNVKHSSEYNVTVDGSDDLLSNFWGVGFKAGFGGLFIVSPYFAVRGNLEFAFRQGTGESDLSVVVSKKDSEGSRKSDLKVEYSVTQLNIDLPLLARVSIPKAVYFEVGPMLSFNVYSNSKAEITDIYGTETYEKSGDLSAVEFDIVTGVGFTRSIGKSILDFDFRFVIGLTRVSDAKDSPKTWQGQLNITYWFL